MNAQAQLSQSASTRVQTAMNSILAQVPYGSRLYGTATAASDYDYKFIYLPSLDQVLLGEKFTNFKARFDENGDLLNENAPMPALGVEVEFIALQTYMRDFLAGQTYAVEVAFALQNNMFTAVDEQFLEVNDYLIENFQSNNVSSMVGFAMKQTFDYVHRGQRLKEAQFFLGCIGNVVREMGWPDTRKVRFDTPMAGMLWIPNATGTVYDFIANKIANSEFKDAIKITTTHNVNKTQRSFTFGGRQYLETTPLSELITILEKRIASYGTRSTSAAECEVDSKSLMHAVRVYQQTIELLTIGRITFPRKNVDELLAIRNLQLPLDDVKDTLIKLDNTAKQLQEEVPPRNNELYDEFREYTIEVLRDFYDINYTHKETFGHLENAKLNLQEAKEYLGETAEKTSAKLKELYKSPEVQVGLNKLRDMKKSLSSKLFKG